MGGLSGKLTGPADLSRGVYIHPTIKVKGLQIQRKGTEDYPSDAFVNWDWDGWIRPQILLAKGEGANTIKWSGGTRSVVSGQQTRAQFHAHIRQFIEYAAEQDLYVYWSSHFYNEDLNADDPATLAEIVAMMAVVGSYENVIGNDCSNEPNIGVTDAVMYANQEAFYGAIKAVAPNLPLSVGLYIDNTTETYDEHMTALGDFVDFWDFHPYYDTPAPSHLAAFRAHANYKPWLLGEIGKTNGDGSQAAKDAQTAFWAALAAMGAQIDSAGMVGYTTQDCTGALGGAYTADFGMFSDAGVERTWISDPFHSWPSSY